MTYKHKKQVHAWGNGANAYRLICCAEWNACAKDAYIIERKDEDLLGEPRWEVIHEVVNKDLMAFKLASEIERLAAQG